ncbi:MAG TPA: hypothetical protein VNQ76_04505 [Planctomicrobium sp.]|nr:hypothetical protein [Planctomicrobium sp.]
MSRHQIRLQGPWDVIPPGEETRQSIRVPVSWITLFGERSGTATFCRHFNSPTNLTLEDRVLIHFPERCGTIAECHMNGTDLFPLSGFPCTFDVTSGLQLSNELTVMIEYHPTHAEDETGGLWQPVILEIVTPE